MRDSEFLTQDLSPQSHCQSAPRWNPNCHFDPSLTSQVPLYTGASQPDSKATSSTLSGLIKGNTYYFLLRAVNEAGSGPAVGPVWEQALVLPSIVQALQLHLVSIDEQSAWTLLWEVPAETGAGNASVGRVPFPSSQGAARPILNYIVQSGSSITGLIAVDWANWVYVSPDTTATRSNLETSTVYYFRVAAVNSLGRGPWRLAENTGPEISAWYPRVIPARGGVAVTFVGKRLGYSQNNIVGRVGQTKCLATVLLAPDKSFECITPPGTGGIQPFSANIVGLSVVLENAIVYEPPLLTALMPNRVSSEGDEMITIYGLNFGVTDTRPEALIVGRAPDACAASLWTSDSSLVCVTPQVVVRGARDNTVELRVDGVQSQTGQGLGFSYTDLPDYFSACPPKASKVCFDCVFQSCYTSKMSAVMSGVRPLPGDLASRGSGDLAGPLPGDVASLCEVTAGQFCGYDQAEL